METEDVFKRLNELEHDQEKIFYELGPVWASPPSLHKAQYEPGVSTHQAVEYLLDRIEHDAADRKHIRSILAGCFCDMDRPVTLTHLWQLNDDSKPKVHLVLQWIQEAGGLQLHDFADGGARFLRLALRLRPQTIARLLAEAAA